jgi:hypothetical protein
MKPQEQGQGTQLMLLPVQGLAEALRDLNVGAFTETKWLTVHTPTAALLLCLGSGPWRLPRRQVVQAALLAEVKAAPTGDVIDIAASRFAFPLEWQRSFYEQARVFCRKRNSRFDDLFDRRQPKLVMIENFESCFGPVHKVPKVLGMFARDFIGVPDAFPIDRHVRSWLKDRKLPTKHEKIVPLLKQHGAVPAAVSRAIFGKHSTNPNHKPTANTL